MPQLQWQRRTFRVYWIPAFAGMTSLCCDAASALSRVLYQAREIPDQVQDGWVPVCEMCPTAHCHPGRSETEIRGLLVRREYPVETGDASDHTNASASGQVSGPRICALLVRGDSVESCAALALSRGCLRSESGPRICALLARGDSVESCAALALSRGCLRSESGARIKAGMTLSLCLSRHQGEGSFESLTPDVMIRKQSRRFLECPTRKNSMTCSGGCSMARARVRMRGRS